jgi:hypothetical protein
MVENLIYIITKYKFGLYKKLIKEGLIDDLISSTSFLDSFYVVTPLSQRYWHIRNNKFDIEYCICNNPAKFNESKSKYVLCSQGCVNINNKKNGKLGNTSNAILKRKITNISRYGVDNYSKTLKFKEKFIDIKTKEL